MRKQMNFTKEQVKYLKDNLPQKEYLVLRNGNSVETEYQAGRNKAIGEMERMVDKL